MTTAIKERPILFSGPMVQAILAGRKSQTRRVVKREEYYGCLTGDCPHDRQSECVESMSKLCPYGDPGERLWVRETFCDKADYAAIGMLARDRFHYAADGKKSGWRYRPSIHMPRLASRITLEITEIRVERLQEISEADAIAEGVKQEWTCINPAVGSYAHDNDVRDDYQSLWESINGPGSWDANPWVWAIEFQRLEAPCTN